MLKLYYAPRSRAIRALLMLEEIGRPYDLVQLDLQKGEQYKPSYLRINPMGKVPAIEHDGVAISESGAILLYLADRFPEAKLAPAVDNPKRGPFLRWLFFSVGCFEPALIEKVSGARPEPARTGWGDFERTDKVLRHGLKSGPWICGEDFTAADVLFGSSLHFLLLMKVLPQNPIYFGYVERCMAGPAWQRAYAFDATAAAARDAAQQAS